jgi:hypothetical protein
MRRAGPSTPTGTTSPVFGAVGTRVDDAQAFDWGTTSTLSVRSGREVNNRLTY